MLVIYHVEFQGNVKYKRRAQNKTEMSRHRTDKAEFNLNYCSSMSSYIGDVMMQHYSPQLSPYLRLRRFTAADWNENNINTHHV